MLTGFIRLNKILCSLFGHGNNVVTYSDVKYGDCTRCGATING